MDSQQYTPQGFRFLPPAVKNLLIINIICYLAFEVLKRSGHVDLNNLLGLHFFKAESFAFYQYITYMFMHANFTHILFNMFALWMFGYVLENVWGSKRFLLFYFVTGIGAGLVQEIVWLVQLQDLLSLPIELVNTGKEILTKAQYLNTKVITVGASGAVYGILLAFGMMFPNVCLYIYFLFPIKAKWAVLIFGLLEVMWGVFSSSDGVAHFAHLGGMIFGFILIMYWRKKAKKNNQF